MGPSKVEGAKLTRPTGEGAKLTRPTGEGAKLTRPTGEGASELRTSILRINLTGFRS